MALQSINPTETKTWAKLKVHFEAIKDAAHENMVC